jgi:flagellar FliJ protein
MPKFNFRLQPVIRVKELQEKKIQRELAQLKKRIMHEQAQLENLQGEREKAAASSPLNAHMADKSGTIRAADIVAHENYIRKISDEIHFENVKIENLTEFESKKINEVLVVKKDKETIEKLKERRIEEFRQELERKEQILIDAVAQRLNA